MWRRGMVTFAAIALGGVVGGAWLLVGSGVASASGGAPSVMIDKPLAKASYQLPDVAMPDDLKLFNAQIIQATGRAPIRMDKDGDSVAWIVELEGDEYVTVTANLSAVSDTKTSLDVSVELEDSPFTEDHGLLASDRVLLAYTLDETFTALIAAGLEDRPVDKSVGHRLFFKLGIVNALDRGAFKDRVQLAFDGAIKPIVEKYRNEARARRDDAEGYGGSEHEARQAQREATAPTSSTKPMIRLPTN